MGTPGLALDKPPMQPPDVTAQQGNPMAGIAAMLANRNGGAPSGAPPAGAPAPGGPGPMLAQADAIKKVVTQMGQTSPEFAPYAERMIAIMQEGLSKIASAQPGAPTQPPPNSAPTGGSPASARPAEAGPDSKFPG